MNRKRCYHIIVGVMIMAFLTGYWIAKKSSYKDNDKTNVTKITKEKETSLYKDGDTDYLFRVKGKYFQKYNGKNSFNFHIFPFDESVYSAIIFLCISDDIVCERVGNNHFLSLFYRY